MSAPVERKDCREFLQWRSDQIAEHDGGARVDVTAADPSDPSAESAVCPHGVRYWLVPGGGSE